MDLSHFAQNFALTFLRKAKQNKTDNMKIFISLLIDLFMCEFTIEIRSTEVFTVEVATSGFLDRKSRTFTCDALTVTSVVCEDVFEIVAKEDKDSCLLGNVSQAVPAGPSPLF
jgi:hypothetical protein